MKEARGTTTLFCLTLERMFVYVCVCLWPQSERVYEECGGVIVRFVMETMKSNVRRSAWDRFGFLLLFFFVAKEDKWFVPPFVEGLVDCLLLSE